MSELNDAERVARGERARKCLEEFVGPEFAHARRVYLDRIIEVATNELHPTIRADKITTLATADRVLNEVENGVAGVFHDGEHARAHLIKAERLENLTDAQRRLINVTGQT